MSGHTPVLVRVQAQGGKFLGPDAQYSLVSVRNAETGELLDEGIAEGDSGQLSATFGASASRQVIATPGAGAPTLHWLSPTPGGGTAGYIACLNIQTPTLVEFRARGFTDGLPNANTTAATMWVTPGMPVTADPGFVLVMPGLRVQVETAAPVPGLQAIQVVAKVTMACGCPIGPTEPWVQTDFTVTAVVTENGGGVVARQPLAWQSTSVFGSANPIELPAWGGYRVDVIAVQTSEPNEGSAWADVTVPAPA